MVEVVLAARKELMGVGLMTGVENQRITRGFENPMERDGQLDHTKVRTEMAP